MREDSGSYTCEAMSNKGTVLAKPDTQVTIRNV